MIKVEEFNDNPKIWDNYVKETSEGTFYHLFEWGTFLEKIYFSLKFIPLAAYDDSHEIIGIIPLILMRDNSFKKMMVSLPYFSVGGVLANDSQVEEAICNTFKTLLKKHNAAYILLKNAPYPNNLKSDFKNDTKSIFVLGLEKNSENIFARFQKQIRRRIRKGYKSGCYVDISREYFQDFYDIYCINMRRLGSPVHKISFYREVLNRFPENSNILVVKLSDKVIGAQFLIYHNKTVYLPLASSLNEYNEYSPNHLLYWESIKYGCDNGYEICDFGRSTVESGPYIFKKQWNASERPLEYHFFFKNKHFDKRNSGEYSKLQLFSDIWKRLPFRITKILGPYLARYLP